MKMARRRWSDGGGWPGWAELTDKWCSGTDEYSIASVGGENCERWSWEEEEGNTISQVKTQHEGLRWEQAAGEFHHCSRNNDPAMSGWRGDGWQEEWMKCNQGWDRAGAAELGERRRVGGGGTQTGKGSIDHGVNFRLRWHQNNSSVLKKTRGRDRCCFYSLTPDPRSSAADANEGGKH